MEPLHAQIKGLIYNTLGIVATHEVWMSKTFHGRRVRVDLYVPPFKTYPSGFYVSCKRQDSSGSADEKIFCEIQRIQSCCDRPTFIVISGKQSGWMLEVAKKHVCGRLAGAYDLNEFASALRDMAGGCLPVVAIGRPSLF